MSKSSSPQTTKVIVRLYRQFDIDLIYLFEVLNSSIDPDQMQKIVKTALRSGITGAGLSANGQELVRSLGDPDTNETPLLRYRIQYQLKLFKESDSDLIEWIESIRKGYRNTAVKAILRYVIGRPCLFPCMETTELNIIESAKKGE